jgi:hypothetical protein
MNFELAQFTPLVGAQFVVETNGGNVELTLIDAAEMPRGNLPERFRTPLSLVFTTVHTISLQQDNYWIEHPAIGRHVWAIAQIMQPLDLPQTADSLRYYEVMFA